MANLVDTSVNGDLRVTGTIFGTQAGNYATCATAAGTADKAVTISGFTLTTGIHVFVKFTVTNTAAVASLTLNVSGTGAKAMKYRGGNLPAVGTLSASRVYEFIYDGANWELVGDLDTNTQTVTGVKGNSESSYRTGQVNLTAANIGASTSDHTHGNIQNGGTLQTNDITIANGDKLVVTDSSDSSKVARASISFDGSTTTQALTKAGTWATFNNYSHPAGSAPSKTGVPTANATPGFGGTFKVNQITTDATSHVSAVTERTITIPNATATTSAAGLMSAADKKKLDGIAAGTASPLMDGKASVGNSLKYAREDHVHPTDTSREDIANKTTVVLGTSDSKYPTDKAVAEFVNSSIATNTANYISNNGEPFTSVEQLEAYSGPVTNNDYAFVTGIDSEGNTYYDRYKATFSGETVTWSLEYRLNNSSFTAAQWSAINSGITSALVAKIHDHSNKTVLDGITSSDVANWNSKQGAIPDAGSAANPVHFKDGKAVAGDSINNCKLTLKVGDATVGDGFTANAEADFEYRVTGEQIASALTAGSGIAISGKTVSTNLPLSNSNEVTVKKNVWYIFAMSSIPSGGEYERCWDFLIASNHNSATQMRLLISPRISASGLLESDSVIQVEGHVTPAQLAKYKLATVKSSSGDLYCCLCVNHSNSTENRTVFWNIRNVRSTSWWGASKPLSNYMVVSERLLSEAMSSNRLVCYKQTNNAAVGNSTQPVYVDANGMIQKCSRTLDTVEPGTASPLMDGKASVGNSPKYAREDHIHPTDSNKLNVDGSNATIAGVTTMMRKVLVGSDTLTDDNYYFGDSNYDHAYIIRRPILDIWNYIKKNLGSVGSADKPIYIENGNPKVCADGVPYSSVSYGESVGYGVFVGGAHNLANSTRLYCTFFVTAALYNDKIAHTYIGTFTFRGGVLNCELKCLTGIPQYPLRITPIYTEDGKDSNGNPTYTVGLFVIPPDKTTKFSGYKLTRIASTSDFIWEVKNLSEVDYDNCNSVAKPALKPIILTWDANGSNVSTTGGTWIPSFDKATIIDCRGIVDMSIQVDLSIIGQRTYIDDLTRYEITLVNSSKTDILPASLHQTGRMPRQTKSSSSTIDGTIDISCTHRFIFPISSTSNLLAGYRPKITLPSNYPLDSGAKVNIKALCRGIVLPYGADEYF